MRFERAGWALLLITACGGAAKIAPPPAPAPPSVVAPPPVATVEAPKGPSAIPGAWDARKQASHALERLTYGPRPGEIDMVAKTGVEAWIRKELHPEATRDDALDVKLRTLPSLSMSAGELRAAFPAKAQAQAQASANATANMPAAPRPSKPNEIERQLAAAKVIRAIESERQFQEVMVDFWFNHFNVFAEKGADRWLVVPYERDVLRPRVFGKFRDLLGAVAHHPAMLFYLDNWLSTGGGLNENYGRELLELHTLGVEGGYTQDDVREVARAFTGWTIEKPNAEAAFLFRPKKHDHGAKTILGRAFPGSGGEKEGEDVLDMVATHPSTAKFVARKLCAKLVMDDPPKALVDRVADVFAKSGGDLRATYEAIVFSPEFWSDDAFGAKVKTPIEVAASAVRAVGGTVDVNEGDPLVRWIGRMGEPLYRQPPPTGYKEIADAWVSTGALVERIDFGVALASGRVKGVSFDRAKMVEGVKLDDKTALLDRLAQSILARPLTQATRDAITAELTRGAQDASGIAYQEAPPPAAPLAIGLLLGSPEFQHQ